MARLYTDGAESGDVLRVSASNVTAGTTQKRTGNYSYISTQGGLMTTPAFAAMTEFYMRFACRFIATGIQTVSWLNGASTIAGSFKTKTYGVGAASIEMYDGTTLQATSSLFSMSINEWHVFEIHVKIAAAPNGIFQVKFDGALVLDFAGATANQASMDRIKFGTDYAYIDDIAINDTTGVADNTWPGDGGVLAPLVPIGAGAYSDLIASAGSPYACIDEIPNSDTDYVYESTIDKKSTYGLSDVAGLPAGASISRVWVELAAKESAAAGNKIATLLRSGAVDSQGADQALTTATARYVSAEYTTDPADSTAWTTAKVNALEAGAVVR